MRGLTEIIQQNKHFEEREKNGDFDKDCEEDCEDCGCPIEDCVCLSYDFDSDDDCCDECLENIADCVCNGTTEEELNG